MLFSLSILPACIAAACEDRMILLPVFTMFCAVISRLPEVRSMAFCLSSAAKLDRVPVSFILVASVPLWSIVPWFSKSLPVTVIAAALTEPLLAKLSAAVVMLPALLIAPSLVTVPVAVKDILAVVSITASTSASSSVALAGR